MSEQKLTYKPIEQSDLPQLAQLYMNTFNGPPWGEDWTLQTSEKRLFQMFRVEDFRGLCVYRGPILCGMILGCMEQYYNEIVFNLREFCVGKELQGCGLGTEIFSYFTDELKKEGVGKILLYTLRTPWTMSFYEKQGMKEEKDLVLMKKILL